MKTYLVYILCATAAAPLAPRVDVAYVSAEKYDGAWKAARGALVADKRGKLVGGDYGTLKNVLFVDAKGEKQYAHSGDDFSVAKIVDPTERKASKLNKADLLAALANGTDAEKLAAVKAMAGL